MLCFRFVSLALLLSTAGCIGVRTHCEYEGPTSGTVEITALDSDAGGCTDVSYAWVTGGPSRFPGFDRVEANGACLATAGFVVGSTFEVTREDATRGSCTPAIRTVTTQAVLDCICE